MSFGRWHLNGLSEPEAMIHIHARCMLCAIAHIQISVAVVIGHVNMVPPGVGLFADILQALRAENIPLAIVCAVLLADFAHEPDRRRKLFATLMA